MRELLNLKLQVAGSEICTIRRQPFLHTKYDEKVLHTLHTFYISNVTSQRIAEKLHSVLLLLPDNFGN